MAWFGSISRKLLGLLVLSLTLSLALAAVAIGIFVSDFHAEATKKRFQEAAASLREDVQANQVNYRRSIAAIAADEGVVASLNMISQYSTVDAALQEVFDAERRKLASELRRLSPNFPDTHVALLDSRGKPVSVLSMNNEEVVEAYASLGQGQAGWRARRLLQPGDWVDAKLPATLEAFVMPEPAGSSTVWFRAAGKLVLAVTAPINKTVDDARALQVGTIVLAHEFTPSYIRGVTNHTGVKFDIYLDKTQLPPGVEELSSSDTEIPALLGKPLNSEMGWRQTAERFMEARSVRLADNSQAYLLFSSGTELLRSQVIRALSAIFIVLFVSTVLVILLGQALANRWISRPVQVLVSNIDTIKRGDYSHLHQQLGGGDEFGVLSNALVQMADTVRDREHELRLWAMVMEQSQEAMVVMDASSRILLVNRAFTEITGYGTQEAMNGQVDVLGADSSSQLKAQVRAALSKQGYWMGEVWDRRKNGVSYPRWTSISAARAADGQLGNYIAVFSDSTERKRAEERILQLNAELEQRVKERTEELESTNEQLRLSYEQLTRAQSHLVQTEKMAALGGLVAGVAHEINTPVGIGVTAASHLNEKVKELLARYQSGALSRDELTDFIGTATEATTMVLANLQRAAELIRSFKQVAVDQTGGQQRSFYLHDYFEEVLRSLRPELDRTRHRVRLSCPEALSYFGNPGDFSQIITNLVMNSLTHGFEGIESGEILVEVSEQAEEILLRYSDDGRGITPENLPRIFDPFYTTRRGQGGSGLGLHVVYNIVTQALGGRISCSSTPGHGVLFEIRLPRNPDVSQVNDA